MYDLPVTTLRDVLNAHLAGLFPNTGPIVTLDTPTAETQAILKTLSIHYPRITGEMRQPVHNPQQMQAPFGSDPFDLTLLVSTNNPNARHHLRLLGHIARFVQQNSMLDRQNHPDLPAPIMRMSLEIDDLPLPDTLALKSAMDPLKLPALLLKLRVLLNDDQVAEMPAIRPASIQTHRD